MEGFKIIQKEDDIQDIEQTEIHKHKTLKQK